MTQHIFRKNALKIGECVKCFALFEIERKRRGGDYANRCLKQHRPNVSSEHVQKDRFSIILSVSKIYENQYKIWTNRILTSHTNNTLTYKTNMNSNRENKRLKFCKPISHIFKTVFNNRCPFHTLSNGTSWLISTQGDETPMNQPAQTDARHTAT